MTIRVWRASLLAFAVLLAGYFLGISHVGALPNLRSQHSQPAVRLPAMQVAVTAEGKTFHRPDCPFIHGPKQMMDAATAVKEGYVPDVRCMHDALRK